MNFIDIINAQKQHNIAIASLADCESKFSSNIKFVVSCNNKLESYAILQFQYAADLDELKNYIIYDTAGSIAFGYKNESNLYSFDSKMTKNLYHNTSHASLILSDYPLNLLFPHLTENTSCEIKPYVQLQE